VFSQFGNILDVHAKKTYKMRGQAWIVFEDLSGATKALKEMAGFNFYGKPMKVSFAKQKSDLIAKADGSFVARPKRKVEGAKDKKGKDKPKKKQKVDVEEKKDEKKKKEKREKPQANGTTLGGISNTALAAAAAATPAGPPATVPPAHAMAHLLMQSIEATPPNRILFVENLPNEASQMMVAMLFQQYPGFTEVRLVAGKPGIAFVEFTDAYQAGTAMTALQNFKITPTHLMKISYARQ